MKKLFFALEVLLMLSALPVFFGLALGRRYHATPEVQNSVSTPVSRETGSALISYTDAVKTS